MSPNRSRHCSYRRSVVDVCRKRGQRREAQRSRNPRHRSRARDQGSLYQVGFLGLLLILADRVRESINEMMSDG